MLTARQSSMLNFQEDGGVRHQAPGSIARQADPLWRDDLQDKQNAVSRWKVTGITSNLSEFTILPPPKKYCPSDATVLL